MSENKTPSALEGVRVLEFSGGVAADFASRLLADYGAEVIKIERPGVGDPVRNDAPVVVDEQSGESRSLLFAVTNWNKKSVALDIADPQSHEKLRDLVASADIILEAFAPGYLGSIGLDYEVLRSWNQKIVVTSISHFGQSGDQSQWQATDLILYAMSGLSSISGAKYPEMPLKHGLRQSAYCAGLNAAYVSLAGLRLAESSGVGEHIDLATRDCLASELVAVTSYYVFTGAVFGRHPESGDPFRGDPIPTGHGYLCMQNGKSSPMPRYSKFFDMPILETEKYGRADNRLHHAKELRELMVERLKNEDAVDVFERACGAQLLTGVVQDAEMLLNNEHLEERAFWRALPDQPGSKSKDTWKVPFELAKMAKTPTTLRTAEPKLGEHTDEILAGVAGAAKALKKETPATASDNRLPLAGLRVIDLSALVAGPYVGAMLADLGAEVIKIEGPQKLDQTRGTTYGSFIDNDPGEQPWNRGSTYQILNRGKRSFVCDMTTEVGRGLLRELLAGADILVENFTPRVLPSWGFTNEVIEEINPRLIKISNSGFGATGPWRNFRSQGTTLELTTGIGAYTGYPGGPPAKAGMSYPDFLACWSGLTAVFAALHYRERTGLGQTIDQGMYQVGASVLPEALLNYQVHGKELERIGTKDFDSLLSGLFESQDTDRWLAISIRDEQDMQKLAKVIPELSAADLLTSNDIREEVVTQALTLFAASHDLLEGAIILQEAGIPAAPLYDIKDLLFDNQMIDNNFYEAVDFGKEVGLRPLIGRPYQFIGAGDKGPRVQCRASDYGLDNHYVLHDILGLDESEIAKLYEDGVIVDEPLNRKTGSPWNIELLKEDGPVARFDKDVRESMLGRERMAEDRRASNGRAKK